ncbi:class I SAM-dependent methyltransferase [Halomonas sp. BC04]|uniref:class I SAM-dependent methyltransferase n=1 Tax=Halomonas sp. BC04 TaxID=1403540 RepID=UPI0003ED5C7F|nr:class I SAM-dependent methyltransferase [Halomonas sp. BC04]EWH01699.1 hypothetical protein Q427_12755 [Halomonas sp. BC04]
MQQLSDIKSAARSVWARGDYDAMMRAENLYEVGAQLVRRLGVSADQRVIDVACGSGNAAIPAAQAGARVTGVDLTPEMLEIARARAKEAGVTVEWVEGDAEDLPLPDAEADVVLSTFGCMFAPRHEVVADELASARARRSTRAVCLDARRGVWRLFPHRRRLPATRPGVRRPTPGLG